VVASTLAGSLRVLVVDDNPDVLSLLTEFLSDSRGLFAIDTGSSVEEARSALETSSYDLAIFDLYMPNAAGTQPLIRRYSDRLPILVVSGKATGSDGYLCSQLNIVGFLDKEMLDQPVLRRAAFNAAVKHRLSGIYPSPLYDAKLKGAFDALIGGNPESVTEWADLLGVSVRALEYSFGCAAKPPGAALALHKLYRIVLAADTDPRPLAGYLSPKEIGLITFYSAFSNKLKEMLVD
jgi:CheY-like chemotaxis protein